jgi:2-dehydropantoate 2-reductase
MQKVVTIAQAKGVPLTDEHVAARLAVIDSMPASSHTSMGVDLERGNRLELPWLSGAIARMGKETNIATPANSFVYAALKHHVMGKN